MRKALLGGVIISFILLLFSYLTVRVPTFVIPGDKFQNYEVEDFKIVYEYHLSWNFVEVHKCDVICPNERGFPLMIRYESEHDEWQFRNIITNIVLAVTLGISASTTYVYVFNKYIYKLFESSE